MIIAAFAEIVSIGAVLPFLAVLVAPGRVYEHPVAQPFIQTMGFNSADQLLFPLTVAFGLAVLSAGALRVLLIWASTRLSAATGADLSIDIYRRTLYQPYAVHVGRNSSEVISGIVSKTSSVFSSILLPVLSLLTSAVMLFAILIMLLFVDPVIALVAFAGFGAIYGLIIRITRHTLAVNGARIAAEYTQVVKSLQEGLGGIRDILIDGSQAAYCRIYRDAVLALRRAQGDNEFIGASPRYMVEALGMTLIAGLAYALTQQEDDIAQAIPVLGAMALGAQRLLPVLQQGYAALTSIRGSQTSLQDVLELLDQPLPDHAGQPSPEPLPFRQSIRFRNMSFRYSEGSPWVLHNLDLEIAKGSRMGFIGPTGAGKSTLLDLLMALLQPSDGTLAIDGRVVNKVNCRAWQAHIAHVPQTIYLADSTIEENIAFGLPAELIDHERVCKAAEQAQIRDLIEEWPDKYRTFVGERGVRLSGGQRQRVGIARALYKQADVIIFDEATSALDNETERSVMRAIESLSPDLTILIIAHRLTTLQNCSRIIEIGNKGIVRAGTYQKIVTNSVETQSTGHHA